MQQKDNNPGKGKKQKKKQLQLEEIVNDKAIKYQQEDSLQVIKVKGIKKLIETDQLFISSVNSICKATENVLGDIIGQKENLISDEECEEIHFRANIHRKANMVNINSHLSKKEIKEKEALDKLFCHCGCDRFKGQGYPICHDMQELSYIGSGILLFFLLSKGLIVCTGIMLTIYGFYALKMYAEGTKYLEQRACLAISQSNYELRTHYSSFNAVNLNETGFVLDWLGLAAMMVWIFVSRLVKCYGFYLNQKIDENLISSSDYAIKIDGLPQGQYNEVEIFQYFQQLYEKNLKKLDPELALEMIVSTHLPENKKEQSQQSIVHPKKMMQQEENSNNEMLQAVVKKAEEMIEEQNSENHFQIKSIQIIYKMQFSRKIIEKIITSCRSIKKLMKEDQDKRVLIKDKDAYTKQKKDIIQIYETLEDLRKKFLSDSQFRRKITTTTAIVEFQSEEQKDRIVKAFGHQSLTFYKKVKETFTQMTSGSSMLMFKGSIPIITRAPEPSDIQWVNCEKSFSYLRILGIFIITFAIICISFGIITGLQAIQFALRDCSTTIVSLTAAFLQILTSIVLVIINAVLWVLLKFMLNYEYNHTQTNKIVSLMNKTFLASWVNIIIIPIIVNYVIYDEYYGSIGIAGFVFDYQMIALAVSLPLVLLNPVEILKVLIIKVRCFRNYFIRLLYRKRDKESIEIQEDLMKKVYPFYEGPEFLIQEAYTFIFPNVMHGLFYCQLQPMILIFVFVQTFLFYWFCKVKVLKMCKIPVMTERLIFEVAIYQMMLAPLFYGGGAFFNSYVSNKKNNPQTDLHFLGAAICFGIGGLNYFNPGNLFQKIVQGTANCFPCLRKEKVYEDLDKEKVGKSNDSTNQRLENYYRNSNSLSLIGFEKELFKDISSKDLQEELIRFCKSHVGLSQIDTKDNEKTEMGDKDKMNNFLLIEPKREGNSTLLG